MRILADSQIGNAVSITATNVKSFAGTDKLQNYHLVDKTEINTGITQIIIDYGASPPPISSMALCGTNISPGATLSLGYSDTDPALPEMTIALPTFTTFNQVWFLSSTLTRRYWVIDINDPDPQDSTGVEIGHIKTGVYTQLDGRIFPSEPTLLIDDSPSTSATKQEYGSKGVASDDYSFTVQTDEAGTEELRDIVRSVQRIEPVLWVPFEDSLSKPLYPPRFGVFTSASVPYPVDGTFNLFQIALALSERF